jgi:hypothetical protein
MPDLPSPITATTAEGIITQIRQIMQEMFEERIGGALVGDVFSVGEDDILVVNVGDGIEKTGNKLSVTEDPAGGVTVATAGVAVKPDPAGAIAVAAAGISVKKKTGYGIDSDAAGLMLKQQAHEVNASVAHSITDPADSPATADALRDDLVINTIPAIEQALNDLGTKINNLLTKLETAEILKTS